MDQQLQYLELPPLDQVGEAIRVRVREWDDRPAGIALHPAGATICSRLYGLPVTADPSLPWGGFTLL